VIIKGIINISAFTHPDAAVEMPIPTTPYVGKRIRLPVILTITLAKEHHIGHRIFSST
jgi:hypothetical protein